ncbi:hypothetical protein JOD82_001899 [Paenibacillus sp. 1182]|uniref:DUF262 domain-containing protein n=1 Tax=Paenibacillus sp. 1182 TaxID=2806565 RepID=UPI001AE1ABE9|nr:DUF262 domain-containing protein [Paenibacillus sp. 1182]MBP1308879.1 hypothetical protein [Paenibacillus sp. 1182]
MNFLDIPQFTRSGTWECHFSLVSFVRFIEEAEQEEGLEMNPDFQRGHVWTEEQQVRYIEFLLRGGKTARTIYLNNSSWNKLSDTSSEHFYVCVDGLQRATAIRRFINNEIRVFGLLFKEFEGNTRMIQGIFIHINDLQTRKDVLQWYIEFNSGGTIHSEEEINRVKKLLEKEQ